MKSKSFISMTVLALSILFSGSAGLASYIECSDYGALTIGQIYFGSIKIRPSLNGLGEAFIGPHYTAYTATSTGPFTLEIPINGSINVYAEAPGWASSLPFSHIFQESFSIGIGSHIWQGWQEGADKLFFDSASISGILECGGTVDTQTAVVSVYPFPHPIYGYTPGHLEEGGSMGVLWLRGYADIPLNFTQGGDYWTARAAVPFIGTFILSGNVSAVPIPSALLLLGSALVRLAIYGRRRLFDRTD